MYNWYTVNTAKVAPVGWHVPTDAEWTTLTTYLGGEAEAGGKLKEAGTLNWISPNTGATNSTGFSALPGGYRYYSIGGFYNVGYDGYWRGTTEYDTSSAWSRLMDYGVSGAVRSGFFIHKASGFSVRCVRD